MTNFLMWKLGAMSASMGAKLKKKLSDESGEVNIIAIVLIIIVVIGLVIIFRTQLTNIINSLFESITKALEGVTNPGATPAVTEATTGT